METNYSNGYLARYQQKLENKPEIKKYTINDYRNLKKDLVCRAATDTGHLGFDPQNEDYKMRAQQQSKKQDYAEKVKERNRLLLLGNKSTKTQKPNPNNRPTTNSPLELNEEVDKNLVRVRDPVTGKIKKVYVDERKKQELEKKKQQKKVHSFVSHQSRISVRSDLPQSSNILGEFYEQEHVKIFNDKKDYEEFVRNGSYGNNSHYLNGNEGDKIKEVGNFNEESNVNEGDNVDEESNVNEGGVDSEYTYENEDNNLYENQNEEQENGYDKNENNKNESLK